MKKLFFLLSILISSQCYGQELGRFTLKMSDEHLSMPISLPLDQLNYNLDQGELSLYEITSTKDEYVPSQLESGQTARLWFILNKRLPKQLARTFVIKFEHKEKTHTFLNKVKKNDKDLIISSHNSPALNYRFASTDPPMGIDSLYKRSGFIHPLYSPGGEVLTRIQAPDHYHHYGIWGPWTMTQINGREVDFWNLSKGQGTVKYAKTISEISGEVFSGFKVLQEHIDFGIKEQDQVAMNEKLDVRLWNVNKKVRIIDYTTTINTSLTNGILLDAYRYGGGIGFRATEKWTKDNSSVLTSEGKTRIDADGTRARWCIVEGESGVKEGRSGILFLSHPSNRMHPEPMRVWPIDANGGRGDMFFEFTPIRYDAWEIKPQRDYTLKYRMIVFDGVISKETAEMYWNCFSKSPQIDIEIR